jgi:hypothetical protein
MAAKKGKYLGRDQVIGLHDHEDVSSKRRKVQLFL